MTRGFYELIGVGPGADLDEVRAAYGRAVAHLLKRREATLTQGGDTAALDLRRAELDEAWDVLSDPARRRRYDAMLAVVGEGVEAGDINDLWAHVSGAMIPPSVAAAARVVDAATALRLAPLPEPPRPGGRGSGDAFSDVGPSAATTPTRMLREAALREAAGQVDPSEDPPTDPSVVTHEGALPGTRAAVAVVLDDARPSLSLPPSAPGRSERVDPTALVERYGYSGALVRALREQRELSLSDLSARTSITERYFEAIEREDLSALPTGVTYLRGYLRKTAELLGVDPDAFVEGYIRRVRHDE